jgi:hypothetical protein
LASQPAKPAFGHIGHGSEAIGLTVPRPCSPAPAKHRCTLLRVHLRMPSIDPGVRAFLWSLVFFLVIWFGGLAVDVKPATAFIIGLVTAFFVFFLIRIRGDRSGADRS